MEDNLAMVFGARVGWLVIVVLADAQRPLSVAEVMAAMHRKGLRPGVIYERKAVADALRYQAGKGRVRRLGRGVYVYVSGSVPRTTLRRWRRTFAGPSRHPCLAVVGFAVG